MGCSVAYTTTDCGSEATYMAELGNTVIGDVTLTCDQDGNWNEEPGLPFPQCPTRMSDTILKQYCTMMRFIAPFISFLH